MTLFGFPISDVASLLSIFAILAGSYWWVYRRGVAKGKEAQVMDFWKPIMNKAAAEVIANLSTAARSSTAVAPAKEFKFIFTFDKDNKSQK